MKKIKKFGVTAVSLLTACTLLSGCGGSSGSKDSNDGSSGSSGDVTLRFWWWGNDDRHEATNTMIKNFEEKNPDIKVKGEYVGFGSLDEKITTMITGGESTTPDVIQMDRAQVARFSTDGTGFYDLNKIENIDLSTYDPEFLETGQFGGIQNGIPLGKNVVSVFLNKTTYDEYDLELPSSWDDLKEAANKFPEGSYPLVLPTPRFGTGIYLQQMTGETEFDDEGNMNYTEDDYKKALEWYMDMVDSGAFNSRKDYLENVGNEPVSLAQNAKFIDGEYAGVLEWTGGVAGNEQALSETNQELVVLPDMLKNSDAKGSNTIAKPTFLITVSKFEKNVDAVGKFVNDFINGEEANQTLGVTRGVPASEAAAQALTDNGQIVGATQDAYDYSQNVEVLNETVFYEDNTLQTILSDALENIELNGWTIDKAADYVFTNNQEQAEKLKKTYNLE